MDRDQRAEAERRLRLLEVVQAAQDRRHEVVDLLGESRDRQEAAERIRTLLGIEDGTPPEVVLDLQLGRLTEDGRHETDALVAELREELGR